MTTDKQKNLGEDSDEKISAAQVVAGDSSQRNDMAKRDVLTENNAASPSKRPKYIKKPLYIVIGALLFIGVIGSLLLAFNGELPGQQKVYAEVAGQKILKQDIEAIKDGQSNISDEQAAITLADKYLTEAMAKDRGVKVSDGDIEAQYPEAAEEKQTNRYAYQTKVNRVYFMRLSAEHQGSYKGKMLIAHFSRNVPFDSALLEEKKRQNPNLGNAQAIAADKKYAGDFINDLYNKINAGTMTFDEAMQAQRADAVVGEKGYPTLSHSRAFNGPISQIGSVDKNILDTIKPGEISKPAVVRGASSLNDDSTSENYWLVVQLDKQSGGGQSGSFEDALNKAKKELGYKINV